MENETKFTAEQMAHELHMARTYTGQDENTGESTGVPLGYVPIPLSSEGNLFAPAFVHARSFKTADMVHLAQIRSDRLPENNIRVIRDVVYEDTDPGTWHIKEIVEFLLRHYMTYFGTMLKDVAWPTNEDDIKYLEEKKPELLQELRDQKYIPRVDIDISKLQFNVLDKPSRTLTIKTKDGKSTFKFRLPRFGDVIALKSYMKQAFGDQDATMEALQKAIQEATEGEGDSDLSRDQQEEYQRYLVEKLEAAADANMALLLKEVDGKKIESLEEALVIIKEDPRFDYSLSQLLKREADKVAEKFGPVEDIKIKNPITNRLETRRFSFRLHDILQAIYVSEPDTYDVSVDT